MSNPTDIEPPKRSKEWRKSATLITGDSMIPGLREAKLSSNKIKVRLFSGEKTKDLMIHLIPNLKKSPRTSLLILGRMMRYIKTKTSCMKNSKI